jgi:hypothetical protein
MPRKNIIVEMKKYHSTKLYAKPWEFKNFTSAGKIPLPGDFRFAFSFPGEDLLFCS